MARAKPRVGVVIPAGGLGLRFASSSGKVPKQFLVVRGAPLIQHTVGAFERVKEVEEIVIAAPPRYLNRTRMIMRRAGFRKVIQVVEGGRERQHSVWNALGAFTVAPDIVLVHDAARPLIDPGTIITVIEMVRRHRAAVVAVRVKDTVKIQHTHGLRTLDRSKLWAVQTPQGFAYPLLLRAHRAASKAGYVGTDDSSLVERLGVPVKIVHGSERNIKVTTKDDLACLRAWLT